MRIYWSILPFVLANCHPFENSQVDQVGSNSTWILIDQIPNSQGHNPFKSTSCRFLNNHMKNDRVRKQLHDIFTPDGKSKAEGGASRKRWSRRGSRSWQNWKRNEFRNCKMSLFLLWNSNMALEFIIQTAVELFPRKSPPTSRFMCKTQL